MGPAAGIAARYFSGVGARLAGVSDCTRVESGGEARHLV
jgi:hypothetical protein